ncbi:MarR family winged helix-turn-helix transcriptional regulator [Quadrisphaera sp. KR29]|uniref:MarR family winged helix-turn-helix transcriptional regulator n=1 Tax=Quadrisphaera sp. KR29 TaxID=3461391 RepID=UPI004044C537
MDDDDRRVLGAAAARVIDVITAAAAELDAGLSPPQLRVVVVLHEQGPSSVSAVAAATRSAVSTASRTADRLSGLGLLERVQGDDRREVLLRLTRRGSALAREWVERRSDAVVAALEHWSPQRRAALLAVLRDDAGPAPSSAGADAPEDLRGSG